MRGGPPGGRDCWLLIGNSRWHWAEQTSQGRRYWSEAPGDALASGLRPSRWAAVGSVPECLDPTRRVGLGQIPLDSLPPWLGIDRALAGYEAWSRAGAAVLVADAGTALSLTWVDGSGQFGGGRLMAGLSLQLRALHRDTEALPSPMLPLEAPRPWPQHTDQAMVAGVLEGAAGALERAAAQLRLKQPGLQLWLTGGDGEALLPLLQQTGNDPPQPWQLAPGLCLDGLARVAALNRGPGP